MQNNPGKPEEKVKKITQCLGVVATLMEENMRGAECKCGVTDEVETLSPPCNMPCNMQNGVARKYQDCGRLWNLMSPRFSPDGRSKRAGECRDSASVIESHQFVNATLPGVHELAASVLPDEHKVANLRDERVVHGGNVTFASVSARVFLRLNGLGPGHILEHCLLRVGQAS